MRFFDSLESRQMLAADFSASIVSPLAGETLSLTGEHRVVISVINGGSSTSSRDRIGVALFASTDGTFDPANDILLGSRTISRLHAHEAEVEDIEFTLPGDFAPGDYKLFAVADLANEFNEISETNNVSAPIAVKFAEGGGGGGQLPGVDLSGAVTAVRAPSTLIQGARNENVQVKFLIINSGTQEFERGKSLDLRAYLRPTDAPDGSRDIAVGRIKTQSLNNFSPADSKNHVIEAKLPDSLASGQYELIVKIDADGRIAETNEANNVLFTGRTISMVGPTVDLSIPAAAFTVSSSSSQSTVRGSATITNVGNSRYRGPTTVQFFFRDANGVETAASDAVTRRLDLRPDRAQRFDRIRLVSAPTTGQTLVARVTAAPGVTEVTLSNNFRLMGVNG